MAIINHTKKFIFIHIPKTAGTSLAAYFSQFSTYKDVELGGTVFGEIVSPAFFRRYGVRKHSRASEIRDLVGKDFWDNSFKFAFVRNPYKRTFSIFTFLKHKFRDWKGNEIMDTFDNFEDFVRSEFFWTKGPDRLFATQHTWLYDGDDLIMNFVGKLENINSDVEHISNHLKLEGKEKLGVKNKSSSGVDLKKLPEDVLQRIKGRYKKDFELFDYKF